jgi:hypothetical protein
LDLDLDPVGLKTYGSGESGSGGSGSGTHCFKKFIYLFIYFFIYLFIYFRRESRPPVHPSEPAAAAAVQKQRR